MKWVILFFIVGSALGWVWCLGQARRPGEPRRYIIFHVGANAFIVGMAVALLYLNRSSDLFYPLAVMAATIVWCSLALTGLSVRMYFLMRRKEYRD